MKRLPLLLVALLLLTPAVSAGEAWTEQLGEEITAVATDEYGDRIFVGTESGGLYCYNSAGSVVWSRSLASAITTLEVSQAGDIVRVYTDGSGRVYSLNGATGTTLWSHGRTVTYGYSISMPRDGSLSIEGGTSGGTSGSWGLIWIYNSDGRLHTFTLGTTHAAGTRLVTASGDGSWFVTAQAGTGVLRKYSLANVPGWVCPYASRISHTINGSPSGTVTDYPIEIIVHKGAGTNSGPHVYLSNIRDDFNDVAFGDSSGNSFPYYLVDKVDGSYAVYRVQIPEIPTTGTTMYVYYNEPWLAAPLYPSDPSVVLFADDFNDGTLDPGKWTATVGATGQLQETGGYLELNSTGATTSDVTVTSKVSHTQHIRVDYDINFLSTYDATNKNRNRFIQWMCPGEHLVGDDAIHTVIQGIWSDVGAWTGIPVDLDAYQRMTILFNPSTSARWILGDINMTNPTPVISSTRVRLSTGDPGEAIAGHMRLNWVVVTKEVENPPSHGAWGTSEDGIIFQASETLTGTIVDIDAPETGDWVAVSTTSKTYIVQITDSGFGEIYNDDRVGTAYNVQVADSGSFVIEGRAILADIFRIDAVQVGTYTTGGPVRHAAVAQKNGLYAAAGSDDGKYYIFSKDETSAWYLLYASDSYDPVTALAMSWRGELLIVGRADGRLTAFQVSEQEAAGTVKLNVFKDNKPYAAAPLRIEESDDGATWGAPITLATDSYGSVALPVQWGNHYRITVGDGETETTLQASPIKTEYVIIVPSELPVRLHLDYSTEYDPATGDIWIRYVDDEAKTNAVTFRLYRTADNALEYEETFSAIPAEGLLTNHTVSWTNSSYRVQMHAVRDSQTITNTWHQWVGADVAALPGELDDGIRLGIWFVVILFVAGLFSYLTGPQGAVVTSLFAAFLVLIDWLPLEPAVVALCVVWAFLGLLGRTSAER